ncbi:hypothetical protein KI387_042260, partial [Taxus chinensis]
VTPGTFWGQKSRTGPGWFQPKSVKAVQNKGAPSGTNGPETGWFAENGKNGPKAKGHLGQKIVRTAEREKRARQARKGKGSMGQKARNGPGLVLLKSAQRALYQMGQRD